MAKTKKTLRLEVAERLEKSFADLKDRLGKTKFKTNIKKAAKALTKDIKEAKDIPTKKSAKKKLSKKSTASLQPSENGSGK